MPQSISTPRVAGQIQPRRIPGLRWIAGELLAIFQRHAGLARQRRALADLDDHLLRDIGISRADAVTESRRPPWDAPCHWHGR